MNRDRPGSLSRRQFLANSSAAGAALLAPGAGLLLPPTARAETPPRRPRVAAIFTILQFRSHAYNLLENFLGPYYFNGQLTDPGVDVVALYADQFPTEEMARDVSRRFQIPLYPSIDKALCQGGKELAVDAVLSIGEHGEYPFNQLGQKMYPRKRFFDQSVAVMQRAGRFVPFFNDKHLSYRWDWARQMYDTARRHGFPLMAGSSVPLAQRQPQLNLPADAEIETAVALHGGGIESYDFHGVEVLQSIVEARRGGETGVAQVQLLTGDGFQAAHEQHRELYNRAMDAEKAMAAQRQPFPKIGVMKPRPEPSDPSSKVPGPVKLSGPHAIRITYADGLEGVIFRLGSNSNRWNFACRLRDEPKPQATAFFNSPWGNRGLFKALSHAIQQMFITGKEPYPAERTLLTTGIVEAVMRSHAEHGAAIDTPNLNIAYQPGDWSALRESGATWKKITVDTPQPIEFTPGTFADQAN
ncbi:twin-arginine translocation signal domain-containing protein [Lignipirellula cremea]|uniref:Twin-arginine translocation signal domain-containing protein n=1 Tax=Lignipirellula cremea TaxID=2528010 RepID=A0A518DT86_9BACT|nr:twin-arginine translocation signal domain-containing protein [Lignipirellula cremea]QDU95033.1 hypothetical protein Pla8534_28440 [Lignipirellula cremea]